MDTYIKDLLERTVSSFAGGVLSMLGAGAVSLVDTDWKAVLSVGAGAAIVSLLKGLAARGVGDTHSASTLPSVRQQPAEPARHQLADDTPHLDE